MERCPNCGQLSRAGAKFCTACGERIADAPNELPSAEQGAETSANGGWPAPPEAEQPSDPAVEPAGTESTAAEPPPGEAPEEESFGGWPTAGASWPETADSPGAAAGEPAAEEPVTEAAAEVSVVSEAATEPAADDTKERAWRLLDELRAAIATFGGEAPRDLSGVITELEIAITPPGAIGHDDLNELREALLRARERPRDLDTIVDLTGRIDAMVALVFAYDRTVAAIERALETLRGDGD